MLSDALRQDREPLFLYHRTSVLTVATAGNERAEHDARGVAGSPHYHDQHHGTAAASRGAAASERDHGSASSGDPTVPCSDGAKANSQSRPSSTCSLQSFLHGPSLTRPIPIPSRSSNSASGGDDQKSHNLHWDTEDEDEYDAEDYRDKFYEENDCTTAIGAAGGSGNESNTHPVAVSLRVSIPRLTKALHTTCIDSGDGIVNVVSSCRSSTASSNGEEEAAEEEDDDDNNEEGHHRARDQTMRHRLLDDIDIKLGTTTPRFQLCTSFTQGYHSGIPVADSADTGGRCGTPFPASEHPLGTSVLCDGTAAKNNEADDTVRRVLRQQPAAGTSDERSISSRASNDKNRDSEFCGGPETVMPLPTLSMLSVASSPRGSVFGDVFDFEMHGRCSSPSAAGAPERVGTDDGPVLFYAFRHPSGSNLGFGDLGGGNYMTGHGYQAMPPSQHASIVLQTAPQHEEAQAGTPDAESTAVYSTVRPGWEGGCRLIGPEYDDADSYSGSGSGVLSEDDWKGDAQRRSCSSALGHRRGGSADESRRSRNGTMCVVRCC